MLLKGEWDYALKLFQWLMPSRFLLIALVLLCTAGVTLLDWTLAPSGTCCFAALILAFLMALPEGEASRRLRKAIWRSRYLCSQPYSAISNGSSIKRDKERTT